MRSGRRQKEERTVTNEEALRYWEGHLERAEEWSDPHWEASERKVHKEYVDAMKMAIEALSEPKTGKWVLDPNGMDWNIPAWRCSECGFVANYIGVEAKGFGNNPMNWAGSKFCPQCGARITGYER